MAINDVNATLEIRGGLQGGAEPYAQTVSLTLDARGFHDPEGIGRSGEDPTTIDASGAAAILLRSFDRADLTAVLDQLVKLRAAL
jgi:hypothetical protein